MVRWKWTLVLTLKAASIWALRMLHLRWSGSSAGDVGGCRDFSDSCFSSPWQTNRRKVDTLGEKSNCLQSGTTACGQSVWPYCPCWRVVRARGENHFQSQEPWAETERCPTHLQGREELDVLIHKKKKKKDNKMCLKKGQNKEGTNIIYAKNIKLLS